MSEHYDSQTLQISRGLYENIAAWAPDRGVTLSGGWAVYQRVEPGRAQQSRDIDLVFHDADTLWSFHAQLRSWGLTWRTHGRNRFNDCHLIGDNPANIRVDVMKSHQFEDQVFRGMRMRRASMIKKIPDRVWLPSVRYLVPEKLATAPKRRRDRDDKRLKDLIDVHNMVFYNTERIEPAELARLSETQMRPALELIPEVKAYDQTSRGGSYAAELDRLEHWLSAPVP